MKKKFVVLAMIAMAGLFVSCQEKEPVKPGPEDETLELVAPKLSASTQNVVLSEDNLKSEALKLSWTSAVPQGKDATVIYTVYANLASKDLYSSPKTFSAGGQLEFSFSGEDVNSLVADLGGEVGSEVELQFSAYAMSDDDNVEAVVSNVAKVKVSTYKEEIVVPATLWIAGSATDAGWDVSKAIAMPKGADGVYKAEDVNLNVTVTDTGFKLYFANDGSSDYFFGPDRSADVFGTTMLYTEDDGSANLFQPAMNGYSSGKYTISFNLTAMKMTLTRTGDLNVDIASELGEEVYPLGGCFEWSWEFTNPMSKVSDKVYEIKNVTCHWGDKGDSGFKIFLAKGKWSPYFAMTETSAKDNVGIRLVTDSEAPQFYPGLLGYEDAVYTIRADFGTMTLTLTKEADIEVTPAGNSLYIVGGGFSKYKEWSILPELSLSDADNDGIYVTDAPVFLDKWCYFRIASSDYKQDYSRNTKASDYWTAQPKAAGDEEPFIPGNANSDWVDGLYTVTFNTKDMSVKCEPASIGGVTLDPNKAFYIFGCNFEGLYKEWEFDDALAMMPTPEDANIYKTLQPVTLAEWCYFKFDKQDWTEYVRDQTSSDYWTVTPRVKEPVDNDKGFSPGDKGLKTGKYNVTLNLNNNTVTITAAE